MKTKLFSLILIFALSGSMAFAQRTAGSKTSFAILGGVNLQNLNGKDMSGDKLENDMLTGFHAGVNVQLPVAPQFYFQPGLMFSTKGAKNTHGVLTNTYKLAISVRFVPVFSELLVPVIPVQTVPLFN